MEDFTAQENVMIPMRKLGELSDARMRDRAAELLDGVGLGDKLRRPSRHLSGGEQQRVAIARALANDPRVILAGAPTGNLDTANSARSPSCSDWDSDAQLSFPARRKLLERN